MTDAPGSPEPSKKSLIELVTSIPTLVTDLVQSEIELFKTEVTAKLKTLGLGAGLLAGAAVAALYMIGVLLTAAILGLSLIMEGWLAALLVAAVLLIVAVVLALIGRARLMRGLPPIPTESIDSITKDIRAVRGIGKRGES